MDQRVQRVIIFITDNLHQDLSLENLALFINLSRWRLSHLFKEDMGVSLAQYIKSLRMQEARQLLQSSSLSVKEVMMRVGILDRSHFERDFKEVFGLTPAQYKAAHTALDHKLDEKSFSSRQAAKIATK
jgi:transcriptional regulator GlxA family with amidase domain